MWRGALGSTLPQCAVLSPCPPGPQLCPLLPPLGASLRPPPWRAGPVLPALSLPFPDVAVPTVLGQMRRPWRSRHHSHIRGPAGASRCPSVITFRHRKGWLRDSRVPGPGPSLGHVSPKCWPVQRQCGRSRRLQNHSCHKVMVVSSLGPSRNCHSSGAQSP